MKNVNYNIAYDYIRKRILNGEYGAGHPLQSKHLAEEIDLSRTTIREALRQLEVDGLVTIQPRLGAKVKTMEFEELSELCDLRLALESHAAGLAAKYRTLAELEEIKIALERMHELTDKILGSESPQAVLHRDLMNEDVRFHLGIISASKNKLIKKEILRFHLINRIVSTGLGSEDNNHQQLAEKRSDGRYQAWRKSHDAIYRAIEQQDPTAAGDEMRQHIQVIIDNSLRMMQRAKTDGNSSNLTEEESIYINR